MLKIGKTWLSIPPGHALEDLYRRLPTYDFAPWNLIRLIVERNPAVSFELIDIGANIGDSIAHFRRFSEARAVAVEADGEFFRLLEMNLRHVEGVQLVRALFCPDHLRGRVAFVSGSHTGMTRVSSEVPWTGQYTSLEALLPHSSASAILKTDTDGFDAVVVSDVVRVVSNTSPSRVPVVFYEGASHDQICGGDYQSSIEAGRDLQRLGYHISLLTNFGTPYVYAGRDPAVIASAYEALRIGFSFGCAPCHYFDFIAVADCLDYTPLLFRPPDLSLIYEDLADRDFSLA